MGCIGKTRARKLSSGRKLDHQGSFSCVGVGARTTSDVAENGGHPTGHISFRDKTSASTRATPDGATAQRGAFARCCRRNGRCAAPRCWARVNTPSPAAAFPTAPHDSDSILVARALSPEALEHRLCATISRCARLQPRNRQAKERDLRRRLKPVAGWVVAGACRQYRVFTPCASKMHAATSIYAPWTRRKRQCRALEDGRRQLVCQLVVFHAPLSFR